MNLRMRLPARDHLARVVTANFAARLAAIIGLTVSTVLVARVSGPSGVGNYALLRLLPGLVGVLAVLGLPGALAYFLAPDRRGRAHMWPTIMAIGAAGGTVGTAAWLVASPLLRHLFFPGLSLSVVLAAGATIATQLFLTLGKTALQGLADARGGDLVIAGEELAFLPAYGICIGLGISGGAGLVAALLIADVGVGIAAWIRVARHLGWRRWGFCADAGWVGRPDLRLARTISSYSFRGQVGGLITLLNLRLDFVILGAMAGPAVLGTYAVASKYAELLRLPGTALTWVCYPRFAALSDSAARVASRRLLKPTVLAIAAAAVPLYLLAPAVMRLLYGTGFEEATPAARILVPGMLLGGAAGVASGYLYGRGRPGSNSLALGAGLVVTVVLDLVLIPRWGPLGAAGASAVAYLVADALLIVALVRFSADGAPTPGARKAVLSR